MTFVRCSFFTLCSTALLFWVAPSIVPGLQVAPRVLAAQSAPAQAPPPASPQNAYSLSPDKLAKAIALSRIRNIMDIVGGLWGIAVFWLLLATRAAVRLDAWAQRISARRWIQGLAFFAAFLVITALASLPLDWFGQHVERNYDISVQGWGGWIGDQGKALGLTLSSARPFCCCSTGSSAAGRGATGSALAGHAAAACAVHLRAAAARARCSTNSNRSPRVTPAWSFNLKRWLPAPGPTFRPIACS